MLEAQNGLMACGSCRIKLKKRMKDTLGMNENESMQECYHKINNHIELCKQIWILLQ